MAELQESTEKTTCCQTLCPKMQAMLISRHGENFFRDFECLQHVREFPLTEQMAILGTSLRDGIKRLLEHSAITVTSTGADLTTEETIRAIGDYLKKKQNP